MRMIKQPGPVASERVVAVEARGRAITFDLEPGVLLVDAVRHGFAAHGFTSGVIELGALALNPFAYVMPALSKTGENAAFYSDTFRPKGVSRLKHGAMTFGRRDGAPFFHCHALWTEAGGKVSGGHILPDETTVAERITVNAFGLDGALFEGATFKPGRYELVMHVGDYYAALGTKLPSPPFLSRVPLRFGVADARERYHIAVLFGPWSYAYYRGS